MSDFDVTVGPRQFLATVRDVAGELHVAIDGLIHRVALHQWVEPTHFILSLDGSSIPVAIERDTNGLWVSIGYDRYRLQVAPRVPIPRRGGADRSSSSDVRVVAPMPGLVVAVEANIGAAIEQGAPIVVLEAMKMQMEIRAPQSGRISTVSVKPGQEVVKGQILATLKT